MTPDRFFLRLAGHSQRAKSLELLSFDFDSLKEQ